MGSLPNLNELCRERSHKREQERELELARERARERGFARDNKERLPIFVHQPQITKNQHRHSLTARRVHRTRSSGATHQIWDDPMIEHMAAYSPISSRSHRIGIVPPYQGHGSSAVQRRRESINSSIGATSIRRLLTVNRSCRHKPPVHMRASVAKNFTFLVVGHGLICAILFPIFGMQGANSTWMDENHWLRVGPNMGSMLLSICFLISSGMCLLTPKIIKQLGYLILIAISYAAMCLFLMAHLYPSIFILVPGYILLGITLGPSWIAKYNLVIYFASRLSCGQQDCANTSVLDSLDEHKIFCNRDKRVRRLARWYHAAQDIGIIAGAVIACLILSCTANSNGCTTMPRNYSIDTVGVARDLLSVPGNATAESYSEAYVGNNTVINGTAAGPTVAVAAGKNVNTGFLRPTTFTFHDALLFNVNEHGEQICGADACPVWSSVGTVPINVTSSQVERNGMATMPLLLVYIAMGMIALILACLSRPVDNSFRNENSKGITDTLLFAGPMAYFIGTEQGYVLGDFTKAYVSCALGPQMVAGALIGMGVMQCIVSCTLSMLLRHTKRIVVIVAGFFFHACLLLVLSRWKPLRDDSALFYVIAAAWGACNAIWETLCFALISLTHTNHMVEVASPLQAIKYLALGITFAANGFLCENPKILILVILLVISVPPYAMLEIKLEAQRKNQVNSL